MIAAVVLSVSAAVLAWSTRARWLPLVSKSSSISSSAPSWTGTAEPFDTTVDENGCDLTEKPGVVAFRAWVLTHFGGYDAGILRDCSIGGPSGHKLGRAWDWGDPDVFPVDASKGTRSGFGLATAGFITTGKKADTDALFSVLFDNDAEGYRRAGLVYAIWQRKIWTSKTRAWNPYTGPDPHTGHVHFSFGVAGAKGATSFYRGLS